MNPKFSFLIFIFLLLLVCENNISIRNSASKYYLNKKEKYNINNNEIFKN